MNKYEKRMNKKRINLSKYVDNVSFHDILFIIIILISWMEGQFSSSRDHQVEYVSFFLLFSAKCIHTLGALYILYFLGGYGH